MDTWLKQTPTLLGAKDTALSQRPYERDSQSLETAPQCPFPVRTLTLCARQS